jgi:hypothetical protein
MVNIRLKKLITYLKISNKEIDQKFREWKSYSRECSKR